MGNRKLLRRGSDKQGDLINVAPAGSFQNKAPISNHNMMSSLVNNQGMGSI